MISLVLSNLAGGECVEDPRLLEKDKGLGRALRLAETHGMPRWERRALLGRWRKEHRRSLSSPSAVSGTWTGSTTGRRRAEGRLTPHSYRPPPVNSGL